MSGVVQGVPVVCRVHVHNPERPADHGRRRLIQRQAARHIGRETDPEQPVVLAVGVHVSAELDPLRVVPQQRLLGDLEPVEGERGEQPGSRLAPFGPYPGRQRRGSRARPLGRQVPRPLAVLGVLRVLVLDHQLVARAGEDAGAGALVGDADRPAPRGVRGDQVYGVLDRRPGGFPPLRSRGLRRPQPVGAQPERGHGESRERQCHLGQRPVRPTPDTFGHRRHRRPGIVLHLQPAGAILGHLHGDPRHPVPRPCQPVGD